MVQRETDPAEPEEYVIWPDNARALDLFLRLRTQWRVLVGFGGIQFQGIDLIAIQALFQLLHIPRHQHRQLTQDLQLMEAVALPLLNHSD
ncbi:hypothetical protein IGB42_02631 [Andreprevotia sp. IGB-42]|uniref:DUF1799 domain-containing protein n=1 Tax=Andreprevotia sp. IGB-42 TaxID=2497473 RepID=UPI001357CFD7|nr:DUF1799 domain-containing protein [Andreprevotia sp. IGB-42]KAF0812788.1 hypothetical protein IGB42_02631 [Andreprevotia sp. IGB-42]